MSLLTVVDLQRIVTDDTSLWRVSAFIRRSSTAFSPGFCPPICSLKVWQRGGVGQVRVQRPAPVLRQDSPPRGLERDVVARGAGGEIALDFGARFTTDAFTACLHAADIQVSMDDRALDHVSCERLWRSVKNENNFLKRYDSVRPLQAGLRNYIDFYNYERPHQSLNYRTPAVEHFVL